MDEKEVEDILSFVRLYGSVLEYHRQIREIVGGRASAEHLRVALKAVAKPEHVRQVREYPLLLALYGRKSMRLMEAGDATRDLARAYESDAMAVRQLELSLSADHLPEEPTIYKVLRERGSTSFIFRSRRLLREGFTINREWIAQQYRKEFRPQDQIRGVRTHWVLAFDVVEVPNDIALPVVFRLADQFGAGRIEMSTSDVAWAVQKAFLAALKSPDIAMPPVDLFDAIKRLFEEAGDGRVVEMTFCTSTHTSRKAKADADQQDLRTEQYHVDGSRDVKVYPYVLRVAWLPGAGEHEVELELRGSKMMLDGGQDRLLHATVENAQTAEDIAHLVGRLMFHLQAEAAARAAGVIVVRSTG